MNSLDLNGLIPATLTPMTEDFQVDESGLRKYIEWLLGFEGLKALAVNMDTGEGPHLTREEKKRVVCIWKEKTNGKLPVLAGVTGPSTADAVAQATDAERSGADGLVIFPIPAYSGQPLPPELPVAYHAAIADSTNIPIVLFQLQPALGGVIFTPETLAALLENHAVAAIKEASFDTLTFVKTVRLVREKAPGVSVLTGNDNFILESFLLGADGALIGFGTIAVREQIQMIQLARNGSFGEAMKIYRKTVRPLAMGVFSSPVRNYRARLKEALAMMRVIECPAIRPPLLPLGRAEKDKLRRCLQQAGLL